MRLIDADKLNFTYVQEVGFEGQMHCVVRSLEIKEAPTVEPDDFLSVMKTSDRMCASYAHCKDCPFYCDVEGMDHCGAKHEVFEDPADFLEVIKAWAKEHPEMPCDAYNSGVCMSNGDKECSCGGDTGICEIMTKKGGIDSVC